jgi:gluconolactonase
MGSKKCVALATILIAAAVFSCDAPAQSPPRPLLLASQVAGLALPRQQEFFPSSSSLELSFSGGCGVMEGPAAAADGRLYFTEINLSANCSDSKGVPGGRIWTIGPDGGKAAVFREPSGMANGLVLDAHDGLIAAEGADYGMRRVSRTDLKTGEYRVIAYFFENRQFNAPNDVAIDRDGRIYFTDIRLFGKETIEQRISGVYRADPPTAAKTGLWPVTRVIGNNNKINGIEVSRDSRTLYAGLCDLGSNSINEQSAPDLDRAGQSGLVVYDLDQAGNPSKPKVWLDLEKSGCVDGMTTDSSGNLYAVVGSSIVPAGVYVFTPAGELVARLMLPNGERPSNVVFGRAASAAYLYITTIGVGKVYRIKTAKSGD